MFDVARSRGLYQSVGEGWVYLNAHEAAQVPERVNTAMASALRTARACVPREHTSAHGMGSRSAHAPQALSGGVAGRGEVGSHSGLSGATRGSFPSGTSSVARPSQLLTTWGDVNIDAARRAIADLVGADPAAVVLGPSAAGLMRHFVATQSRRLGIGNDVVLARTLSPRVMGAWLSAVRIFGTTTRWLEADLTTGSVPVEQIDGAVSQRTAAVVVPLAHRLVGTLSDVPALSAAAHAAAPDAWVVADVTDVLPYRAVTLEELGADMVALDVAPLGGPQLGALVFADPSRLAALRSGRDAAGHNRTAAGRSALELDCVQPSLAGAIPALVDHWAALGLGDAEAGGVRRADGSSGRGARGGARSAAHSGALSDAHASSRGSAHNAGSGVQGARGGRMSRHGAAGTGRRSFAQTRHERVITSVDTVNSYVSALHTHLALSLEDLRRVHVIGWPGVAEDERVGRCSFIVPGVPAPKVYERLARNNVVVGLTMPGEDALLTAMGADELGGVITVGLAPYNTAREVNHLVRVVAGLN